VTTGGEFNGRMEMKMEGNKLLGIESMNQES